MKNKIFIASYALILCSTILAMEQNNSCIVFIGNPGVGKSTLINSILNKCVFESGLSASGITKFCQCFEYEGILYIDTPGLSDTKIRNQAAIEIEKALKKNKVYKIFFVLTLEAGRVKPEDLSTINSVMKSINCPDKAFNIIINKVTKKEKLELFDNICEFENLCSQINSTSHKTNSICYIERDRSLEDDDIEFIPINEKIKDFIFKKSKCFYLNENQVVKINSLSLEELKQKSKEEEERLRHQLLLQRQREYDLAQRLAEQQRQLEEIRKQQNSVMCPCCRKRLGLNF